jgi:ParB/RepB/Spo0J family partition protein
VSREVATLTSYDYILIDRPPSLNLLTINAMTAAHGLLVLQCEFFALEGLSQLLRTIELVRGSLNPTLEIQGVVLTMYDKRNNLSEQVAVDVRQHLGEKVYQTIIPRNVRISEAPSHGLPALLYDLKSAGSQAYIKLAGELIQRESLVRQHDTGKEIHVLGTGPRPLCLAGRGRDPKCWPPATASKVIKAPFLRRQPCPARQPSSARPRTLPIALLRPNPFQPREHFDPEALEELAASVRDKGVIQPIIVRPVPGQPDEYQIVAGERRWRAAQKARLHEVPVVIKALTDAEALEVALIENIQRADLNPIEEARGYRQLIDRFNYTQDALGQVIGRSRSHIANTIRLLQLPQAVQDYIYAGKLGCRPCPHLVGQPDPEAMAEEFDRLAPERARGRGEGPQGQGQEEAHHRQGRRYPRTRAVAYLPAWPERRDFVQGREGRRTQGRLQDTRAARRDLPPARLRGRVDHDFRTGFRRATSMKRVLRHDRLGKPSRPRARFGFRKYGQRLADPGARSQPAACDCIFPHIGPAPSIPAASRWKSLSVNPSATPHEVPDSPTLGDQRIQPPQVAVGHRIRDLVAFDIPAATDHRRNIGAPKHALAGSASQHSSDSPTSVRISRRSVPSASTR